MKKILTSAILAISMFAINANAEESEQQIRQQAQQKANSVKTLSGDAKTACEIILCLAAVGTPPTQCIKPLDILNSMKPWKLPSFLAKCPR